MGKQQVRNKIIGVPLQKSVTKQADGSVVVRGYFTSDQKDEVGDIITRSATEKAIPKYKQWSNLRYMHLPRPVGKVLRIGAADGLEWNEVEIKVIDPQAAFEVEQGLLTALSVGILIDIDNIDFLEDGGWIINEYSLAEISLVDHPANYDAKLKDLPVDHSLRTLVRAYGMSAVATSMSDLLEMELKMENTKEDAVITEELEKEIVEQAEDVVIEEAIIEDEKELEADAPVVDAEVPVEEVESEKDLTESDGEEEVEKDLEEEQPDAMQELVSAFRSLIEELSTAVSTLKVLAEAQRSIEQTTDEAEEEQQDKSLDGDPEDTNPVNRSSGVPETEIPNDEQIQKDAASAATNLRDALQKYFSKGR